METILNLLISVAKFFLNNPSLLIILILALLANKLYTKFRGFMGEFWVKTELRKLPKEDYIILNNIMLEDEKGTHQIDHIIVSKYGIFVIEMKNYFGMIVGDEYKKQWIQYLGKNKYYFQNPIHQNYGHLKALEDLLTLDNNSFISIVCFSNQAKLKVKTKSQITQVDFLINVIKSYDKILINDINKIVKKIEKANITDKSKRINHVNAIKKTKNYHY